MPFQGSAGAEGERNRPASRATALVLASNVMIHAVWDERGGPHPKAASKRCLLTRWHEAGCGGQMR